MVDVNQVSELLKIEVSDINQLIAHGKIKRPHRLNGRWEFNESNIAEIKSLPRDVLPSVQRLFRQKAFWSKKINGVNVPATVIALVKAICEDPSKLDGNLAYIVDNHAAEFIAYSESIGDKDTYKSVFNQIEEACKNSIELKEALNLISKSELISTRQLAAVCGCNPNTIRNMWKERRIAPSTQSYAGALLWKLDFPHVEAIKNHLSGACVLPASKFAARRDIVHYEVEEDASNQIHAPQT